MICTVAGRFEELGMDLSVPESVIDALADKGCNRKFSFEKRLKLWKNLIQDICEIEQLSAALANQTVPESR